MAQNQGLLMYLNGLGFGLQVTTVSWFSPSSASGKWGIT
jgi:hypothetical protein